MQPQAVGVDEGHAVERPREARHLVQDHVAPADPLHRGAGDRAVGQRVLGAAGVLVEAQHQAARLAAVVVEAAQQRQHERIVLVLILDVLARPRFVDDRMAAPEQQVGKAEARAGDRFALRRVDAQFEERVRLAVVPDQPHAAVAAQRGAAEVEAGQPRVRPREPARRVARPPYELTFAVQPEQLAVVADRPRPAGQRQRAAIVLRPRRQVGAEGAQAEGAARVAHEDAELAPHQARRGDDGRGQHGFRAVRFADRVHRQPVQPARGRHEGHVAAARAHLQERQRQPAVVGCAEREVGRALFRQHHVPDFGQRIPVLQHAAPRRQREQALLGEAERRRGEHAVRVRRRRHRRIEASDFRRRRPFLETVAQRQRRHRQAMRHVARQHRIGMRAPPVGPALRHDAEARERPAARGTECEAFGIDGGVVARLRQRGAEQVRAVGETAARGGRPVDPAQPVAGHEFEPAALLVLQPDAGRRFPSVCHALPP